MAMRELLRVTLDARRIKEACEAYVGHLVNGGTEEARANVPADMTITVIVSKRRKPRKVAADGNGVASAHPLSDAEQRFA